jgi:hypothetical protein
MTIARNLRISIYSQASRCNSWALAFQHDRGLTQCHSHIGDNLFGRMQDMNRAWLQKLQGLRQAEAVFAGRLLCAKTGSTPYRPYFSVMVSAHY